MVIKVCTVDLETLIKNYAIRGIDKTIASNKIETSINWNEIYADNLTMLLSKSEEVVVVSLRKLFGEGFCIELLNTEDYEQLKQTKHEGNDYCIRVVYNNETLCILSKKEIK